MAAVGGEGLVAGGVIDQFAAAGRLASGWTVESATDVLWTVAHPHHHQLLTGECGWSTQRYRHYIRRTVEGVVLHPRPERRGPA